MLIALSLPLVFYNKENSNVLALHHTRGGILSFLFVRSLNALFSAISAGWQRRHLMAWALFAPKFIFEACTLLVADIFVLVACVTVSVST